MSVRQNSDALPAPGHGAGDDALFDQLDALAERYGNRFLLEPAPDNALPKHGMRSVDAMRLVEEELVLDGIPMRNLATFVTTWMEPEAQRVIAENLHRNFIDHAEYPQTAEIEQRCIRMLADLFHAPGETTGARTQGSSEAIMLGALSLKWKWRERREAAGKGTERPNLVFGGDVHVVWEKFCRYFDVEPRIIPLQPDKYTIGPEDVEPHVDENTIGVAAVLGTTFTGHTDDIVGINDLLVRLRDEKGLDVPLHVDGASGGFVWPFLYPDSKWDFRLEQVRSINVSGHKYGLVYPGIGWLDLPRAERPRRGPRVLRELPRQDRRHVHAELLDRLGDGARAVLQLRPPRPRGLPLHHGDDAGERPHRWPSGSRTSASSGSSATRTPSSSRWWPSSSRASTTTTSSTSRRSWRPSAAGWCRPTRCRRTPTTSRSCARWSS